MANESDKLIRQIVFDEIKGKNSAIHAYDKMIWTIRTGFLTLLFAGWGLLLSAVGKNINSTPKFLILLPL